MSAPASRKSFLAKIAVLGLAVMALPGAFGKRRAAKDAAAGRGETDHGDAAPKFPLTPDPRAVARDSAEV